MGPTVSAALAEIGVHTEAELRALGAVETYRRLQARRGAAPPRRPYLYGLDAALAHLPVADLPWRRRVSLARAAMDLPSGASAAPVRTRGFVPARGRRRR